MVRDGTTITIPDELSRNGSVPIWITTRTHSKPVELDREDLGRCVVASRAFALNRVCECGVVCGLDDAAKVTRV